MESPNRKTLKPRPNFPLTPSSKVNHLTTELQKKETENEDLKNQIADLTKALNSLAIVKDKTEAPDNPFNFSNDMDENKTKKTKKALAEGAPDPAMTAYRYFCQDFKANSEGGDHQDINMRQMWKECRGDARKKYMEMAEEDKKRFDRENKAYQKKVLEQKAEEEALEIYYEKKKQVLAMEFYEAHASAHNTLNKNNKTKRVKDPDAPKGAKSSYLFFCQEKRDTITRKHPGASPTEITKLLADEWSKLQKNRRATKQMQKFEDLAAKDKARYEKEKQAYDDAKAIEKQKLEQERELKLQKDKEEALKQLEQERELKLQKDREEALKLLKEETDTEANLDGFTKTNSNDKKKEKDPDAPKGASSSYTFFCQDKREEYKKKNEGKSPAEITKILGEEWTKLKNEENGIKQYEAMAAEDKLRYEKEKEAYEALKASSNKTETNLEKAIVSVFNDSKKKKDPNAPKGASSSYMFFCQDKREEVTNKNEGKSPTEITKILGEEWTKLKNEENGIKQYEAMAAEDKLRYEKEKEAYDALKASLNNKEADKDKEESIKLMKKALKLMGEEAAAELTKRTKLSKSKKQVGPKKPSSAYIFFVSHNRSRIKASMEENSTNQQLMAEVGLQWKNLDEMNKEKYIEMAAKDKERYEKELAAST